jgi:hypothetical protein
MNLELEGHQVLEAHSGLEALKTSVQASPIRPAGRDDARLMVLRRCGCCANSQTFQ